MADPIYRCDLDAAGKTCYEGYYAVDSRGQLVLIPPTGEMAPGLRLATVADVDRGGHRAATVEDLANCDATPSDKA